MGGLLVVRVGCIAGNESGMDFWSWWFLSFRSDMTENIETLKEQLNRPLCDRVPFHAVYNVASRQAWSYGELLYRYAIKLVYIFI